MERVVKLLSFITIDGTAYSETCLCEDHLHIKDKILIPDDTIPNSWTDVTENCNCSCGFCDAFGPRN